MAEPAERLAERIEATSDRLYKADFLKRGYLADYVADVQTLIAEHKRLSEVVEAARASLRTIRWQSESGHAALTSSGDSEAVHMGTGALAHIRDTADAVLARLDGVSGG